MGEPARPAADGTAASTGASRWGSWRRSPPSSPCRAWWCCGCWAAMVPRLGPRRRASRAWWRRTWAASWRRHRGWISSASSARSTSSACFRSPSSCVMAGWCRPTAPRCRTSCARRRGCCWTAPPRRPGRAEAAAVAGAGGRGGRGFGRQELLLGGSPPAVIRVRGPAGGRRVRDAADARQAPRTDAARHRRRRRAWPARC